VDTLRTVGAILFLLIILPVCILWLRDRIFRRAGNRNEKEKRENLKRWVVRLLSPQFDATEKACGGLLPDRLRSLYEEKRLILMEDLEIFPPSSGTKTKSYWVATFIPLDAEEAAATADLSDFGRGCCFATDGMGNYYWVEVLDKRRTDSPVYFACHDPYGNEKVADSLEEFLSCLPPGRK